VKVLLVTSMFPPYCGGGVSSHVRTLATALSGLGHEPWILTSRRGRPVNPEETRHAPPGTRVVYARSFVDMVLRVGRLVREERFDLVHLHAFNALAAAPFVRGGPAVVFTLHSDSANYLASVRGWARSHPAYRLLLAYERLAIRLPDVTIAVSGRMEAYGRGIQVGRIVRIPNAVDSDFWTPSREPSNGSPRAILVPRMHVPKNGIEYAIEAMKSIARQARDARMFVTGDGPLRERLEAMAGSIGGDRVRFPGMVSPEELRELYRRADVVLIPSVTSSGTQENTSIAALEAMACGTPVVASDIGGLSEVIRTGQDGFLVPERDPHALAKATLALLTDPELARRMGEEAREHVRQEFSVRAWANRVAALYESILRKEA